MTKGAEPQPHDDAPILVWDLPTRAFHWLLTATFVGAFGLSCLGDKDGVPFQTHMVLGLGAAYLVILRVVWGFVGGRYARFQAFLFGPAALFGYLRAVLRRAEPRHVGHNPGSAWAAYAMLLLPLGLAVTGMVAPLWAEVKTAHAALAWLMLSTAAVHVVGLVLHTRRHRENIALSMIHGKKAAPRQGAVSDRRDRTG